MQLVYKSTKYFWLPCSPCAKTHHFAHRNAKIALRCAKHPLFAHGTPRPLQTNKTPNLPRLFCQTTFYGRFPWQYPAD